MMSGIKILSMVLATCLFVFSAHADRKGNGGDEAGIEFEALIQSALSKLDSLNIDPAIKAQVHSMQLMQTVKQARIFFVETSLTVMHSGILQESIAINQRQGEGIIQVNRWRWKTVASGALREAIALHEVLSLHELESTGRYPISGAYVAAFGLSAEILARSIILEPPTSLTGTTQLTVTVSKNYLQSNYLFQSFSLSSCQSRTSCTDIIRDINDQPFGDSESFNRPLKLRPGLYRIALASRMTEWTKHVMLPLFVQLQEGGDYKIPLTEVYFPSQEGTITAFVSINLNPPAQKQAFFDSLVGRYNQDAFSSFIDWEKAKMDIQYHRCGALAKMGKEFPVEASACRTALKQMALTPELALQILNPKIDEAGGISYMGSERTKSFACGTDEGINELQKYLKKHPYEFLSVMYGPYGDYRYWSTRNIDCQTSRPTRVSYSVLGVVEATDGMSFLLTPGVYTVVFKNESGAQSRIEELVVGEQDITLSLSAR